MYFDGEVQLWRDWGRTAASQQEALGNQMPTLCRLVRAPPSPVFFPGQLGAVARGKHLWLVLPALSPLFNLEFDLERTET